MITFNFFLVFTKFIRNKEITTKFEEPKNQNRTIGNHLQTTSKRRWPHSARRAYNRRRLCHRNTPTMTKRWVPSLIVIPKRGITTSDATELFVCVCVADSRVVLILIRVCTHIDDVCAPRITTPLYTKTTFDAAARPKRRIAADCAPSSYRVFALSSPLVCTSYSLRFIYFNWKMKQILG